ncbi:MAG: DUF805 domain-containing protein [Saprospiraceae bacterium]
MQEFITVFKRWNDFSGRSRRKEYWMFVLITTIISFGLMVLGEVSSIFGILYFLFALATIIPNIAVGVRRMHDVGKSGWFLLIPIYNLILALTEGERGPNKWGPDPKGGGYDELKDLGKQDLV